MNVIDKNFNNLVKVIQEKSLEEIFSDIREKYLTIPSNIQIAIEDFFKKFAYWGELKKDENNFEELYNRAESLKNHIDDYINLYNNLKDYRSKKLLYAILNNWYNFDFNTLNTSIEKNYSHYFDLDVVKCDEKEVIVDVGAYTGDTIIDYLNNYGSDNYQTIYCYEITKESIDILKNNLKFYKNINVINKAASDEEGLLYLNKSNVDNSANMVTTNGEESIETGKIDDDISEKISLIKMDIEGFEQKALKGAENHIKNDKPKLLISVYHNHEDLWKIPSMINEMNPDYKFYLRYYGNNIFPTEIVLIAI